MSRAIVKNVLMNKHDIRETYQQIDNIPFVDSDKPKHIEEILGNHLRVLKDYPLGHDFCVNMVAKANKNKRKTKKNVFRDYSEDYYEIIISQDTFDGYFEECVDAASRYSLKRQLQKDLEKGIVQVYGKDKIGKYIDTKAPFRIRATRRYIETPTPITNIQVLLLKEIYGSLVEGTCTKNGNEGFCKIPAALFPKCTQTGQTWMKTYNPIYRTQVLGLSKNTNKQNQIEIPRLELLRTLMPVEINKYGYMERLSFRNIEIALGRQAAVLVKVLPQAPLVIEVKIRKYGDTGILVFQNPSKE
jgi:hypothetical protein